MWKFAGFDDEGSFLLYNKDGEVIPAAQKTENDKQYIGNYTPKLIIGWSHTLTYKNFDLGITCVAGSISTCIIRSICITASRDRAT